MKALSHKKPVPLWYGALQVLLLLVGVGLLAYAGIEAWRWFTATHNPNPVITPEIVTYSTTEPDETPPVKACEEYAVPAGQPRQIDIPSIGASGCIQRVGIDQHNAIAVPNNIHLAGWYVDSATPGDVGVSLLVGHVLGRYNDAIFANLKNIQVGDTIRVQMGDASWREFRVLSRDMYSIEQTSREQLRHIDGVERQLTLITCGGTWLPAQQTYDQRIVVRSQLIQ